MLLVCCHFTRNSAYYRAGWDKKKLIKSTEFWKGINGNCIDIAVLEWCKLFGDRKDPHCWRKIASDPTGFEVGLYKALPTPSSAESHQHYIDTMREYRDKFVAHLDDELIANIPGLDDAITSTRYYYNYIFKHESSGMFLTMFPADIGKYYENCFAEARKEYCAMET